MSIRHSAVEKDNFFLEFPQSLCILSHDIQYSFICLSYIFQTRKSDKITSKFTHKKVEMSKRKKFKSRIPSQFLSFLFFFSTLSETNNHLLLCLLFYTFNCKFINNNLRNYLVFYYFYLHNIYECVIAVLISIYDIEPY